MGDLLQAKPSLVFEGGQWWSLFTSSFIHGDLSHLLSNSLMLTLMGYFVASYYGGWVFPGVSFLAGGLINYLTISTHVQDVALVGASGVVYFLWGFWLVLFLFLERHVSVPRRLMKIAAISLAVLVPTSYQPNVSYLAHGIGLLVGVGVGMLYYIVKRTYLHSFEEYRTIVDESELPVPPEDQYWNNETLQ